MVQVVRASICGSDLWGYRGGAPVEPGRRTGHEFLGTVAETGAEVTELAQGDLVVAPFMWSDGTCDFCLDGLTTSCVNGGVWGMPGSDGGQGEAVRVPYADATLVKLPAEAAGDDRLLTALLALADVLGTGHHAAVGAGVRPGATAAVRGGVAPVRTYIPELLPDVLDGGVDPSPVFDTAVKLDGVPEGYRAMDARTALKVLVKP